MLLEAPGEGILEEIISWLSSEKDSLFIWRATYASAGP